MSDSKSDSSPVKLENSKYITVVSVMYFVFWAVLLVAYVLLGMLLFKNVVYPLIAVGISALLLQLITVGMATEITCQNCGAHYLCHNEEQPNGCRVKKYHASVILPFRIIFYRMFQCPCCKNEYTIG